MEQKKELGGKVALITGAARNMGRAFAVQLARAGARIAVHYHGPASKADAMDTMEAVVQTGSEAILLEGDLREAAVVKNLFDQTLLAFGQIDIVINNAGKVIKKPMVEITEQEFNESFDINTRAAFFVMQQAARTLADNGRIINMGTTILGATIPHYAVYAGSKAPLEDFSRALAKEIGQRGITVNVVAPGPIDTTFLRDSETPESIQYVSQASVAKRLGQIDDIAPLITFLASPAAQWITGQTLFINGGFLAR